MEQVGLASVTVHLYTHLITGFAGASPRAKATSDWTPVHFAAREGHVDIVRMLVT